MFLRLLLPFLLLLTSCGRKQRTIFQFPEKEPIKISKLSLPAVRGLQVTTTDKGKHLTWYPLDISSVHNTKYDLTFLGYHVYRSAQGYFIPKRPLTKHPIRDTYFIDASSSARRKKYAYLVRGVFACENIQVQGPASQLIGLNK